MNKSLIHNNGLLVYYVLLMALLLTWTNPNALPPLLLRIGYLLAASLPVLFKRKEFFPIFFCTLIIISMSRYAPSYMVSMPSFVFIATALFFILFPPTSSSSPFLLVVLGIYILLINLIMGGEFKEACFTPLFIYILQRYLRPTKDCIILFIASFICISLVLSVEFLTVGKYFTETYSTDDFERMGWMDPNVFGCIIGIGILSAILAIVNNIFRFRYSRIVLFSIVVVCFMAFLVNASRGASVALAIATALLVLLGTKRISIKFLSVILLSFIIFLMYYGHFFDNLVYRMSLDNMETGGERFVIWETRLKAFFDGSVAPQKVLFGMGDRDASFLGYGYYLGFHNDYLAMLMKYGIVGFVLWLSLLFYPIKNATSNKAIVIVFVSYLAICAFTLDLMNTGHIAFYYLLLFLLSLGKCGSISLSH